MAPSQFMKIPLTQQVTLCANRVRHNQASTSAKQYNVGFEGLFQDISTRFESVSEEMKGAIASGDQELGDKLYNLLKSVSDFRNKVSELEKEWKTLVGNPDSQRGEKEIAECSAGEKLARGLRTPEENFHLPILQVIEELGGKAESSIVRTKLSEKMAQTLKPVDFQCVNDGKTVRWWNTAQWARNTLKDQGFLKSDSQHGIWEISDKGRARLACQRIAPVDNPDCRKTENGEPFDRI
jgi:hypothetical protein